MKLTNEAKVALTIIAALIAAFLGFRAMQDLPVFRQAQKFYTCFERVDGLSGGSYIYISGVKVGSVKGIELMPGDSVRVSLSVDLGIDIPEGSVAYLQSSGLLDEKGIVIEKGTSGEMIGYEGYIRGVYRGGLMETFKDEGEKLSGDISKSFDNLNRFLEELNSVLTGETRDELRQTIANLEVSTGEMSDLLSNKRSDLEASIDHANNFLANLDTLSAENRSRIDSILTNMESSLKELETLSNNLNSTSTKLNEILEKINRGEGSIGRLVNDPSLYENVDSLAVELKNLIKNINERPKDYLKYMRLIEIF